MPKRSASFLLSRLDRTRGEEVVVAGKSRQELADELAHVARFSRCTRRERATVARHVETATLAEASARV